MTNTLQYYPHSTPQLEVLISLTFPGQVHNLAKSSAKWVFGHSVQVTAGKEHKWHHNMRQLTSNSNKSYAVHSRKLITDPVPVKTKAPLWGN